VGKQVLAAAACRFGRADIYDPPAARRRALQGDIRRLSRSVYRDVAGPFRLAIRRCRSNRRRNDAKCRQGERVIFAAIQAEEPYRAVQPSVPVEV